MLKKIFRWALGIVLFLLLVLLGAGYGLKWYLAGNEEKLMEDYLETQGMSVSFRAMNIYWWEEFPSVTLTVDSLVMRDTLRPYEEPALAEIGYLRTTIDFGRILDDTLGLRTLIVRDANFQLISDSTGRANAGRLFPRIDTSDIKTLEEEKQEDPWHYDYQQVLVDLANINVSYISPIKHKRIEGCVNEVLATAGKTTPGHYAFEGVVDLDIHGLGFNTTKGAYLRDSRVYGPVEAHANEDVWRIDSTVLNINGEDYRFRADITRRAQDSTRIYVANDSAKYDLVIPLLHDELQQKLSRYYVDGTFVASISVALPPKPDRDAGYFIDFACEDAYIRMKQYEFGEATVVARISSALPPRLGGVVGNPKDLLFSIVRARANWDGINLAMENAQLALPGVTPYFYGQVQFSGTGPTMTRKLKNDQFFFRDGTFVSDIDVDGANLMDNNDMIRRTNGVLSMQNMTVDYPTGDVKIPFENILLRKIGEDVTFALQSQPMPESGMVFDMIGDLNQLQPLLITGEPEAMTTNVRLHSPNVNWTDLTSLLGDPTQRSPTGEGTDTNDGATTTATKASLLGLRDNFGPNVDLRFDTVSYYDVFTLHDFSTGVHFERDTLVLERTRFNWLGSEVDFAAHLDVSHPTQTPFGLNVNTEGLNLHALRPSLEYFGFTLPAGIDSLPTNLNVDLDHRGRILDSVGLMPGHNAGDLYFDDGRASLFDGHLHYAPTPDGFLATELELAGDPHIVNILTGAENFLFGSGDFTLDLRLPRIPADLAEVLKIADLDLRIDSSRLSYPAAGLSVPIRTFDVRVQNENADYELQLATEIGGSPLHASGRMERLGAFLIEGDDRTFRVKTDVRGGSLHWSEIADLAQSDTPAPADNTEATDTVDVQSVLSATGGIFQSFRPDLSLRLDTFFIGDRLPFTDIHAGLYVDSNDVVTLEESGFNFGDGQAEVVGTYQLDTLTASPFQLDWRVEKLTVDRLIREFSEAKIFNPDSSGYFEGTIGLSGSVTGVFDEPGRSIIQNSVRGDIGFDLREVVLEQNPTLVGIGKKALMRKRMLRVLFAALNDTLRIEGGILTIPRTEIATTGFQAFIEGSYDLNRGPDLLLSVPLRNIGYGLLDQPPPKLGYDDSGWMVHFVFLPPEEEGGAMQQKFRFGRKKWDERRRARSQVPPPSGVQGGS